MTTFKGTAGKWFTKESHEGGIFSEDLIEKSKTIPRYRSENGEIAQCWADLIDGKYISDEECIANAKLMATSPELLELVIEMKIKFETTSPLSEEDLIFYQRILDVVKRAIE
jgi:hypothetical protein